MSCIFFLNIGNTHTQVAENAGNDLRLLSVYDTKSLDATIPQLEENVGGIGYAVCVVPALKAGLQARYGQRLHFLSCMDFAMLDFSMVDTSTLGMDRIANAAAAFAMVKGPVIVVDCGTCVNTVIVDGTHRCRVTAARASPKVGSETKPNIRVKLVLINANLQLARRQCEKAHKIIGGRIIAWRTYSATRLPTLRGCQRLSR